MESIKNTMDKRVVKTRSAIRRSFEDLASEKDVARITVKEIADRASINRKTFYMHYTGVADVLNEIENDMLETVGKALRTSVIPPNRPSPALMFRKIAETLEPESALCDTIVKSPAGDGFASKLKDTLKTAFADILIDGRRASKDQVEPAIEYVASGMASVYRQWAANGRTESIEDISKTVEDITTGGMRRLLE
jgi:AcrR family transcriptional regulator